VDDRERSETTGSEAYQTAHLERTRTLPFWILGLTLLALAILPGQILVVRERPVHADAIVVIGGDHKPQRVRRAVRLYDRGLAPLVIFSSGTVVAHGDDVMTEAEVMQRMALKRDLPSQAMLLETASLDTIENAKHVRDLCQEHDLQSLLLVTSAFHSRRANRAFHQVMDPEIAIYAQPAHHGFCSYTWWLCPRQTYALTYEYWAWISIGLDAMIDCIETQYGAQVELPRQQLAVVAPTSRHRDQHRRPTHI
jgi:uncharacterized SAM-binding protein YcdF (DUF218 family)